MGSISTEAAKRLHNHEEQAANLHCLFGMGDSPSMIDDILMRPPTSVGSTAAVHAAEIQQAHGYNTDHALLTAALSGAKLNVIHVTEDPVHTRPTPTKRLQTPVKATARQAFQQRLLETASALIQQLNGRLSTAMQEATAFLEEQQCENAKEIHKLTTLGDRPAGDVVDELGNILLAVLSEANVAALETCATVMTNPGGVHHKPKMVGKQRRRHMATLKQARQLCGKLKRALGTAAEPYVREEIAALHTAVPTPTTSPQSDDAQGIGERDTPQNPNQPCSGDHTWRPPPGAGDKSPATTTAFPSPSPAAAQDTDVATLHQIARMESEHIRVIDAEHRKESIQLQQDTLCRVLKEKPKQGHKMLFATAGAQQHRDLEAVLDPITGRVTTSPDRVGTITEAIFREQQQPPTGIKDGIYLPEERPKGHPQPWNGDLDHMQLCTDATLRDQAMALTAHP
jgi:hypothetical protein